VTAGKYEATVYVLLSTLENS